MSDQASIDLHIHSALSPCASDDMRPPAVLLSAERRGVELVAVVDHNTARNAGAFLRASEAFDVEVLVGLEVESAEGVHLLALFLSEEAALAMDAAIAAHLTDLANRPEFFGRQLLLDEMGDVLGEDQRLLAGATDLAVEEIAQIAHNLEGAAVPAHIDRRANGLMATLGLFPRGLTAPLLELSPHISTRAARERWPGLASHGFVRGSDAHQLEDVAAGSTRAPSDLAHPRGPLSVWEADLASWLLREEPPG